MLASFNFERPVTQKVPRQGGREPSVASSGQVAKLTPHYALCAMSSMSSICSQHQRSELADPGRLSSKQDWSLPVWSRGQEVRPTNSARRENDKTCGVRPQAWTITPPSKRRWGKLYWSRILGSLQCACLQKAPQNTRRVGIFVNNPTGVAFGFSGNV